MKKLLYIILSIVNCQLYIVESQWVQQTVPVTKPITGIKFINANTGWACTSIGTGGLNYCYILGTTNGGTNWIIQDSTFDANNYALSVVDANIAYAGGSHTSATANLHKTTNGGLNWILIPTPTNMVIFDMQFLNKDSGWTAGGLFGPDVRTTTNGGLNWTVRTNGMSSTSDKIFFLNYSTGFCAANFFLYKTTNTGQNWVLNGNFSEQVQSVFFFNESTGWVGTTGVVYYTSNGGTNWTSTSFPPLFGSLTDIKFVTPVKGYFGNISTRLLMTTNGGINWGYQTNVTGSYRISFADTNTGWIGDIGISKTTNGGGNYIFVGISNISTETPANYNLYQNSPNPFNPTTKIYFDINTKAHVNLVVFDVLGRTITQLVNTELQAGKYEYIFEADILPSGIYFYKLITGGFTQTKKMILLK